MGICSCIQTCIGRPSFPLRCWLRSKSSGMCRAHQSSSPRGFLDCWTANVKILRFFGKSVAIYQSTGLNTQDGFNLQIYYYRARSLLCDLVNKKLSGSKQTASSRFTAHMKNCQLGQTIYGLCSDIEPVELQDGNSSSCFPFNQNVGNHFLQCNVMPTDPALTVLQVNLHAKQV